ncbi:MAG: CGNR zinc finger domain-containing protein [Mycobacterium sp.]
MAARNAFSSSQRLGLQLAPEGLSIVQDVINTAAIDAFDIPDLLVDADAANRWAAEALGLWSERTGQPRWNLTLGPRDLTMLRRLRTDLRRWLLTGELSTLSVPAKDLTVGMEAGRPTYRPRGDGAAGLTALISMELLLATRSGTADRLRVCMNHECSAAFYDQSKNGSRVWHDVKACGNIANLRASRARRRNATPGGGSKA